MKTILINVCALLYACGLYAQSIGDTTRVRGDYFGMLIPVGSCSNERLEVEMSVTADGHLTGRVHDWDDSTVFQFFADWPIFTGKRFTSDTVQGDTVRGAFGTGGVCRGTAKFQTGCKYTFVMYRRFKIEP
jgi:hypothetical protein